MIDLAGDDPETQELLVRALDIIDMDVQELCREFFAYQTLETDCELVRLSAALPSEPLGLTDAMAVALSSAWGALTHLSHIIRNPVPTSPVVLQSLIRVGLVGAARVLYVLLPPDPADRENHARAVLAKDCDSGHEALRQYAQFGGLAVFAAPEELRDALADERKLLWPGGRPPGDGKVVAGMIESIDSALQMAGLDMTVDGEVLADHGTWLWNTYSGLAHAYLWPRLLPGNTPDRRFPGDYPLDLHQVATATHMAALAALSRALPHSANTTNRVPATWNRSDGTSPR